MKVAFTGHRTDEICSYEIPNPVYTYVTSELKRLLTELNPEEAYSGMAVGVDTWAAEMCIELGIPFVAMIPFVGQESIWPDQAKAKYRELLSKASRIVTVSAGGFSAWKMQKRNMALVDSCDVLIGVYDGRGSGGTFNCLEYAKSVNRDIRLIDPKLYKQLKTTND